MVRVSTKHYGSGVVASSSPAAIIAAPPVERHIHSMSVPADYGITLVRCQLSRASWKRPSRYKVVQTKQAMGLSYTSNQPGFLHLAIAHNSVILFEK